ncbi:hypothetical protein N5D61_02710 [Pseudomonas sp. GD03842]|uniref:hypothetical protein n=1 Tax=Pseudomonas sp. GD03842 TaxID=2975385 RepID=UPI002447D3DD|nr:hypothetical protein [Pseudomonas sp. GD03842]MDH0745254.1 hypothetical protein [Pseudomonas sp. GD03842]
MSKRKPCNRKAQVERSMRALLGTNHAAVISIDPSGLQIMINWKTGKQIRSRPVADALCDIAHRWTMHIAGVCVKDDGTEYIKMTVFTPDGIHRVASLADLVEHFYDEVKAECNPNHRIGMGWLAVPGIIEVSDEQVSALLSSVGAWRQLKVAA